MLFRIVTFAPNLREVDKKGVAGPLDYKDGLKLIYQYQDLDTDTTTNNTFASQH